MEVTQEYISGLVACFKSSYTMAQVVTEFSRLSVDSRRASVYYGGKILDALVNYYLGRDHDMVVEPKSNMHEQFQVLSKWSEYKLHHVHDVSVFNGSFDMEDNANEFMTIMEQFFQTVREICNVYYFDYERLMGAGIVEHREEVPTKSVAILGVNDFNAMEFIVIKRCWQFISMQVNSANGVTTGTNVNPNQALEEYQQCVKTVSRYLQSKNLFSYELSESLSHYSKYYYKYDQDKPLLFIPMIQASLAGIFLEIYTILPEGDHLFKIIEEDVIGTPSRRDLNLKDLIYSLNKQRASESIDNLVNKLRVDLIGLPDNQASNIFTEFSINFIHKLLTRSHPEYIYPHLLKDYKEYLYNLHELSRMLDNLDDDDSFKLVNELFLKVISLMTKLTGFVYTRG